MSSHTTFKIGGRAATFIEVENAQQLQKLQAFLYQHKEPYFILGNGSNLLVGDKGYQGVILHIGSAMNEVCVAGNTITAQAGAMLSKAASIAMEHSLTGLEFASGIPGSVGGGVMMNAGAYDGEMCQVVTQVKCIDEEGNEKCFDNKGMEFGYRSSILKKMRATVTEVTFELQQGEKAAIKEKMADFNQRRRSKQPLEYPSAGSTFKRPEGYFAGKLIMDAGLRGYQVGGAQVSEKHCGFVINTGNATAAEVQKLITDVKTEVYNRFQVELEPEVIQLGDF